MTVLPSLNLIDGKAKQFDDGLYAALDLAYYQGLKDRLRSHVELIRRFHERTGKDSPAAPFLAAGLELVGVKVEAGNVARKDQWLREFRSDEVASKPIGFYTWNEQLGVVFRFLRFFQHEFEAKDLAIPLALARALEQDESLRADYLKALDFYARLTNPYLCLSVSDLTALKGLDVERFAALCLEKKVSRPTVALLPPSATPEVVLFERLFPMGLPENADLMRELIRRIRSGEVDLRPGPGSGWYDHQVYALETLLLPGKGEESNRLLLTKEYKKRMLEAFQVLVTRRQETHVRQRGTGKEKSAAGIPPLSPEQLKPRLRVEPCPSFFLRTARAYTFLANFLEASVGKEALQQLHGLCQGGRREKDLYTELQSIRELFYGLYLVSAEDIGHKPAFAEGEAVDAERCYKQAEDWLAHAFEDKDVAADTRVAVPMFVDRGRKVTRLWATLGVRLAKLDADYARPPHIKPKDEKGAEWKLPEHHQLGTAHFLIPVDEFAEVQLPGMQVLTREELRAVCDREKTREAIVKTLQNWKK